MKSVFNCKISSDKYKLQELHSQFSWIPGSSHIRPNDKILRQKLVDNVFLPLVYNSIKDYVFVKHFNFKPSLNDKNKIECLEEDIENKIVLVKNEYPYELPPNTFHYVLWYSHFYSKTEKDINQDIFNCLTQQLKHQRFEFVWYENPNMSIPEVYHLQVFWHIKA